MGFWDSVGNIFDAFSKGNVPVGGQAFGPSRPSMTRSLTRPNRPTRRPPRVQVPGISTADILARLEALQDPSKYMMDPAMLERQAMAAASAQYDPLITELSSQMRSAQSRGERNKVELGSMFGALSTNLMQDIPAITQSFGQTKQTTQQEYDTLKNSIQQQYAQSQKEQEDMMKRLNIEAAAPDILPEQQRDRDYFTSLASTEGQTAQTALGMEERGATEFTRKGSELARVEGTQRQANLMTQLAELLNTYESQIGSQRAAKQQAYTAGLGELQSESQKNALTRSQRDFENYIKSIQLGRQLRQDEMSPIGYTKSPADIPGRALSMGLDEYGAQSVQDVFMSAVGGDESILAGIDSTFGTALPKEALAARVMEAGRQAGLSRQELNALQTIALEYFGRR